MGDTSDGESTQDFCRRVVAPSKRKMEAELDVLGKDITEKDNRLRSIQVKLENLGISSELQKIRGEKESKIDKRKKIDRQLSVLNGDISKKKELLAKLKSSLLYLKEERINEAIRRLNRELQTRNFRLNEEKKIVNEIDSLNRSKRALKEYQDLSGELDYMKEKQKNMRDELNECYKSVSSFKTRETDLRSKRDVLRREIEGVKAELEGLHQKKRDVISDFRRREREFKEHKEMREQKMKKMKEEEVKMEPKQKESFSEDAYTSVHVEPLIIELFSEEKQLCTTLLTYLQRYVPPTDQPESAGSPGPTDQKPVEQDGMYVLPRKRMDEDEVKYSTVVRRVSSKNKRRDRSKKIQVTHTPEIFAQFAKLNLNAPSKVNEVLISIEQLKGRRQYYESAIPASKTVPQVEVGPKGDATDSIVATDDTVDSKKPTGSVADSIEQSRDENSNERKLERTDSEPKTDFAPKPDKVETEIPLLDEARKTVAPPPKIEREKESQGSDDVFYDSDDDVFCDDSQNIATAPLEKRRNFTLVSSRSDIKPLMANADFLADAIRGCSQNGFVMPSAQAMCPTMTSLVQNPLSNTACSNTVDAIAESCEDDLDKTEPEMPPQKLVEMGASAVVLNQDRTHIAPNQDNMCDAQNPNPNFSLGQVKCNGVGTVAPLTNGASNHTDSSTGNLSDMDVDSSVHDLLCEINKLSNGTASDVDIEPSTDSSDITDSYESPEQNLIGKDKTLLSSEEGEMIRPVICPKGQVSPENLDDSLEDKLKVEDSVET